MTQTDNFGKARAFTSWPILAIFKTPSFFEFWVFWGRFFTHKNSKVILQSFFTPFSAFFIFDHNWTFCKGYSLCVVANFGHFHNANIFRILGVFGGGFLHTTTLKWSYNHFLHLSGIWNFDPDWPSLFSNIRCFLERFFAHNNSNVVVQ